MKWIVAGLVAVIALAVGAWWYEEYRAESALLRLPVYQVLQKHHRPLFDELVAECRLCQGVLGSAGLRSLPATARRHR